MKIPQVKKICVTCKKVFYRKPSRAKIEKNCSKKCANKSMVGHRPFHWKGGKLKHKGYYYILVKGHPFGDRDGYVLEHRIIMEDSIGRYLTSKEVVHHINSIRDDNRIENLKLVANQAEHMSQHYPKGTRIYRGIHPRQRNKIKPIPLTS